MPILIECNREENVVFREDGEVRSAGGESENRNRAVSDSVYDMLWVPTVHGSTQPEEYSGQPR